MMITLNLLLILTTQLRSLLGGDLPPAQATCVSSCSGETDGDYQSCNACNVYVSCLNEAIYEDRPCPAGTVWDDNTKKCEHYSQTCFRSCQCHLINAQKNSLTLPDGLYSITHHGQLMQVYCDMTQDGGGWTLVVHNNGGRVWTRTNVYELNPASPGLSTDYSILSVAEGIKLQSSGAYFEYRIAATARRRWGGIWRAPRSYVLNGTSHSQTNVKMVTKFDSWDPLRCGLFTRVPWLYLTHAHALLYGGPPGSHWWGTLTTRSASSSYGNHGPAPYLEGTCRLDGGGDMTKISPIYYWLREQYN